MIRLYRLWKHDRAMFVLDRASRYVAQKFRYSAHPDLDEVEAAELLTYLTGLMLRDRNAI